MKLTKEYFLIVMGSVKRIESIKFDNYPSDEEIIAAIQRYEGESAIVEERVVITNE